MKTSKKIGDFLRQNQKLKHQTGGHNQADHNPNKGARELVLSAHSNLIDVWRSDAPNGAKGAAGGVIGVLRVLHQ